MYPHSRRLSIRVLRFIFTQAFCTPFVQSLNLHAYAWHTLTATAFYFGGAGSWAITLEERRDNKR